MTQLLNHTRDFNYKLPTLANASDIVAVGSVCKVLVP